MGVFKCIGVSLLKGIGFAVTGPIAGSIAACIQSIAYGGAVGARSLFAFAQSAVMSSAS
jgi:hypothetical protein